MASSLLGQASLGSPWWSSLENWPNISLYNDPIPLVTSLQISVGLQTSNILNNVQHRCFSTRRWSPSVYSAQTTFSLRLIYYFIYVCIPLLRTFQQVKREFIHSKEKCASGRPNRPKTQVFLFTRTIVCQASRLCHTNKFTRELPLSLHKELVWKKLLSFVDSLGSLLTFPQ